LIKISTSVETRGEPTIGANFPNGSKQLKKSPRDIDDPVDRVEVHHRVLDRIDRRQRIGEFDPIELISP
jgi:hypothetical protein